MSVEHSYVSQVTIGLTLEGEFVDPSDDTVTLSGMNTSVTLGAGTTPAVTKGTAFQQALSGGAATIDLTALPGLTGEETIDGTGLKIQTLKLANPSDNNGTITVVQGASNAYQLGGANFTIPIPVGGEVTLYFPEGNPDVASGAKEIDLSGTGTDPLNVSVTLG